MGVQHADTTRGEGAEGFDPAALAAHLRRHGVEVGEVRERYGAEGYGPSLYICDPDGNTVELKGPATRGL